MTNETKFNMRDKIVGTIAAEVLSTLNIDGMGPWNAADKIIAELEAENRELHMQVLVSDSQAQMAYEEQKRIEELEAQLAAMTAERDRLEQRYQREVLGLNNEGDPIGGHPPIGLKARAEAAEAKLVKAVQFTGGVLGYAGNIGDDYLAEQARAAFAELKGTD